MADLISGDNTVLSFTLKNPQEETIDLTGQDVVVRLRLNGGTPIEHTMENDPDQVNNTGLATYALTGTDLNDSGELYAEVELTDGFGNRFTSENPELFSVREQLD